MIFFITKQNVSLWGAHTGEPGPAEPALVEYAQADEDELFVACEILGRPMPRNRVFTFVGDDARTIAFNWR